MWNEQMVFCSQADLSAHGIALVLNLPDVTH